MSSSLTIGSLTAWNKDINSPEDRSSGRSVGRNNVYFRDNRNLRATLVAMLCLLFALSSFAATVSTRHEARSNRKIKESSNTEKRMAATRHSRAVTSRAGKQAVKAVR